MISSKQIGQFCLMCWCWPGDAENNLSINSSNLRHISAGQLLRTASIKRRKLVPTNVGHSTTACPLLPGVTCPSRSNLGAF